jgi:hypothetical protein
VWCRVPRPRLLPDYHLLIRIVKLDSKLAREDRFWWGSDPAIKADGFLGERWLSPFGNQQHLSVEDFRDVGVVEGGSISILRCGRRRVRMSKRVGRIRLVAKLGEINGIAVLGLVGGSLEKEGLRWLAPITKYLRL